nr:hypothetical protein [Tanacetum cinerariifolium]GFC29902.1 hypothetical protein [Tanacetum cinerariifolium]
LDNTKTRRPQPRSNTKNDRVPSASKRFIKRLATPKPRKPRFLLRWSPTGEMFDQYGKLVAPSNSESHVDCSHGYPDLFMVRQFRLFQAHDRKSKASHQFRLEVYGNCPLRE